MRFADFFNIQASPVVWHIHMVFATVLFLGLVFFIIWAVKVLDKKQLKKWTVWLLVIGIIGAALTCPWGLGRWYGDREGSMFNYMFGNDWDGDVVE